jgi:cytochrome c5
MSDQHDSHGSAIKTPKQLVLAIAAGFLVPIICIILLVELVGTDRKVGAGSQAQSEQAIAARISPVADQGFTLVVGSGQKQARTGEAVYTTVCAGCHGTGAAGAPKAGDAGAWSGRIAQGFDTLVKHAITGIRAMPPKGGNPDLSDVEVGRAVAFMANQSGAKFKEP